MAMVVVVGFLVLVWTQLSMKLCAELVTAPWTEEAVLVHSSSGLAINQTLRRIGDEGGVVERTRQQSGRLLRLLLSPY